MRRCHVSGTNAFKRGPCYDRRCSSARTSFLTLERWSSSIAGCSLWPPVGPRMQVSDRAPFRA